MPASEPVLTKRPIAGLLPLGWGVAVAALVAGALLSYTPAFHADYIRFDDTGYVQGNPHVASGLRLENIRWALTTYEQSNWHPLTWISHMVDVEIFGVGPAGPHGVNIALHAVNAAVLFLVLRALTGAALPSLLVASLFAVHPANVESVAWISQRKTLLSTFFALLAIAAYARYVRRGGRRPYLGSLALLALSLLSKPMFVTLPFGLLLLDYWPLERPAFAPGPGGGVSLGALVRGWWRLLPEKIPHVVLCGLLSLVTLDAQRNAMSTLNHYSVGARLANVALSYVRYLAIYFAPRRLAVFYPLFPESTTAREVVGAVALLGVLTVVLVRGGLRRRYLLVGWLWFLGTLVPVIGLVQVGMQSMADRYAYVPFWGLSIACVWSLRDIFAARLRAPAARASAAAVAGGILAALCVLTYRQAEKWHDAITLFQSAIANTDGNWLAHGALAERYYAQGDLEKTVEQSVEAAKYNRNLGTIRSTYGLALHDLGKPDLALEQFDLAAQQEPDNPLGLMNLGWLHVERQQYELAIGELESAAAKVNDGTPLYTQKMIYANWATALARLDRLAAAREKYELALAIEPGNPDLLRDAARVDIELNDPARAIERMRRALETDPRDADAAYLLASATALQGGDAEALFRRAWEQDPAHALVTVDLARTLARQRRDPDALRLLQIVLALDAAPADDPARRVASSAHAELGEIALDRGDPAAAVASLDRAVAIWPDDYDANSRLAFLLATATDPALRDPPRAVALAERAASERREFASLSTLAAAYAAAGRLPAALDTARQGLELASKAGDPHAAAALQRQIEIYSRSQSALSDSTPR